MPEKIYQAARLIGFQDTSHADTTPIYALARVDQSAQATVRSVPHLETIAYMTSDHRIHPIGQIQDALWVAMIKLHTPSTDKWMLYFASMHANGKVRNIKYDPVTNGPLTELGQDEHVPAGLRAAVQITPHDLVNAGSAR